MSLMSDNVEKWANLAAWLNDQIAFRNWSIRKLAREAGISHTVVARMANAQGPFSAESCNLIAVALGVSGEEVQRIAGILPPAGPRTDDVVDLVARLEAMSEDLRQETIGLINALINYRRRMTPSAEDRLAVFRAAFGALSDEEQDEALQELQQMATDQPDAQSGGQ
jgi:transcriptional regulator with XRE-family HTH domain